jgi:hypothetical protein
MTTADHLSEFPKSWRPHFSRLMAACLTTPATSFVVTSFMLAFDRSNVAPSLDDPLLRDAAGKFYKLAEAIYSSSLKDRKLSEDDRAIVNSTMFLANAFSQRLETKFLAAEKPPQPKALEQVQAQVK